MNSITALVERIPHSYYNSPNSGACHSQDCLRCQLTTALGTLYREIKAELESLAGGEAVAIVPTHEAADAFWAYWRANGETHKHGYYESTWGAINAALRVGGVVAHPTPSPDAHRLMTDALGERGQHQWYGRLATSVAAPVSSPAVTEEKVIEWIRRAGMPAHRDQRIRNFAAEFGPIYFEDREYGGIRYIAHRDGYLEPVQDHEAMTRFAAAINGKGE